jgi:hypothetical protein
MPAMHAMIDHASKWNMQANGSCKQHYQENISFYGTTGDNMGTSAQETVLHSVANERNGM